MTGSADKSAEAPRVFISYARAEGEEFSRDLRERLEAEDIPLWQDRTGMEGGRDWWEQIVQALDRVEFMVLIMTPRALESSTVRKEWLYARRQGVCVYPVKTHSNLDPASLPGWMRDLHFYDLEKEWKKFINDLNTHCQKTRVPFMVEDLPADFVKRPDEFKELISKLLNAKHEEPVAITAALRGAGGYGKTTMAKALCHDDSIQEAFHHGILWVTLGENLSNLVGKVEDLIYILSEEKPGFTGIEAAIADFVKLLADRKILLVIDDVWNEADLNPFLQGGKCCARLITTRDDSVLPSNSQCIQVDAMHPSEAVQLLSAKLGDAIRSQDDMEKLRDLAERLGEWPLLLKLVNGALRERVNKYHLSLSDALAYVNTALAKRGLTFFDARNAQERSQAVAKTLRVSFELLNEIEYARYNEMAIFPKDMDIPLVTLQKLWGATGGLDDFDTEVLCERLHRLSLLLHFDLTTRTIRLHDVVGAYLQQEIKTELAAIHEQLLDAYELKHWAELANDEPYLWNHLAEHLINAGRVEELIATVEDLSYIAKKIHICGVRAAEAELALTEEKAPNDVALCLLKRNIASIDYLLNDCETLNEIKAVLHSRLVHLAPLSKLFYVLEEDLSRPFLTTWHTLPDLPHPALIRTLQGHTDSARGCAVSPKGDYIVSASEDGTLKVWDALTGTKRLTLFGHESGVNGCAVSPKGDYIVSASEDGTLKVWDPQTGAERLMLHGHGASVTACTVSPKGDYIVSTSEDRTIRVWDAQVGHERLTLRGHLNWVSDCAVSPKGDYIVSASWDKTLQLWEILPKTTLQGHMDLVTSCVVSPTGDYIVSTSYDRTIKVRDIQTGVERLTLHGHMGWVTGCAVSPGGDYIVSSSYDGTVKVWNTQTGTEQLVLHGYIQPVRGCVFSPLEDYVVAASEDKTLKVWDAQRGVEYLTLSGHTDRVNGCAVSPRGDWIVSASEDKTLRVWDAQTGTERLVLYGHESEVNGCVVSPSGDYIVSASEDATLKVWNTQTGQKNMTLEGHTSGVKGCAISPKGDWIVSASDDEKLIVWDALTGRKRHILHGHSLGVNGCAVSPLGDFIVSASSDKTLKVWDVETGAERLPLHGHAGRVSGCAVSPKGDYIVSTSGDGSLKVWEVLSGTCMATLRVDGELWTCAFCRDGEHIVAGGERGLYFLRFVR